jgi:fatty acid desaturase
MLRAIVTLLALGLVGMTVLSLLFGILMPLLVLAIKVALVLVVGYFVLRLVSPGDAEKVREKLRRVK